MVPLFELEQHESGVRIFGEGEPGNKVYIMLHGIVIVCKGSLELATLDAAASDENVMFGEMEILDRKPRMAAVYSKTVRCLALERALRLPRMVVRLIAIASSAR